MPTVLRFRKQNETIIDEDNFPLPGTRTVNYIKVAAGPFMMRVLRWRTEVLVPTVVP